LTFQINEVISVKRRDWLKMSAIAGVGLTFAQTTVARTSLAYRKRFPLSKNDFGKDFNEFS